MGMEIGNSDKVAYQLKLKLRVIVLRNEGIAAFGQPFFSKDRKITMLKSRSLFPASPTQQGLSSFCFSFRMHHCAA